MRLKHLNLDDDQVLGVGDPIDALVGIAGDLPLGSTLNITLANLACIQASPFATCRVAGHGIRPITAGYPFSYDQLREDTVGAGEGPPFMIRFKHNTLGLRAWRYFWISPCTIGEKYAMICA